MKKSLNMRRVLCTALFFVCFVVWLIMGIRYLAEGEMLCENNKIPLDKIEKIDKTDGSRIEVKGKGVITPDWKKVILVRMDRDMGYVTEDECLVIPVSKYVVLSRVICFFIITAICLVLMEFSFGRVLYTVLYVGLFLSGCIIVFYMDSGFIGGHRILGGWMLLFTIWIISKIALTRKGLKS